MAEMEAGSIPTRMSILIALPTELARRIDSCARDTGTTRAGVAEFAIMIGIDRAVYEMRSRSRRAPTQK